MERIFLNENINARMVFLIDENGEKRGKIPIKEALRIAKEKNFDLIAFNNEKIPTCKLIDYGKFLFEKKKKEKENKKNQVINKVKEIRLSFSIAENDINTKVKQAKKFINDSYKIKVTARFRGREMIFRNTIGKEKFDLFVEKCSSFARVSSPLKIEGNSMSLILEKIKL